ncbi:MAG: 16S rRNA (cytosine(1402)-N(4))-methyltransferase RsmH [Candidatus Paceibacterota bacterium]
MHQSVLLQEVIDTLDIKKDDIVLDATFGGGGHSMAIAKMLGSQGVLIAVDTDNSTLLAQRDKFSDVKNVMHFKQANFRDIGTVLNELNIPLVDKYVFDLGFSSIQLEEGERGLSFKKEEPLLMTLTDIASITEDTLTAKRIVNEWKEDQIEAVLRGYGGEGFSKQIAEAIVASRKEKEITTTIDLRDIILKATPFWYHKKRIDPATRTFQALRIAVNDEIETAKEGIEKAFAHLTPGGRIAVITFHSTEDRVVKRLFQEWKREGLGMQEPKKAIAPTREEIQRNPRARSAKLRTFRKDI